MLIMECACNNAKNRHTDHILFKLYRDDNCHVFLEDEVDFYSKSRSANKLARELRELISICK